MNEKDSDEFKSTPVSKEHENENEFYPLQTSESIEIVNSKSKKNLLQNKFKFLDNFLYLLFILATILLIIQFILILTTKEEREDGYLAGMNLLNVKNKNKTIFEDELNGRKINVGFLYPSISGNGISRFMQVTGDNFIRSGKYNVIFITKAKQKKELSYNPEIKRFYCYENFTLIKKVLNDENIDFLIMNNMFSTNIINHVKAIGVKTIGIYHGVFFSSMFNNDTSLYNIWKNLENYDAHIHISAEDYYFLTNFGFQRNIFIPNMYTFDKDKTPQSELKTHNIMMLGRLNDKKKGVIYAVKAMASIVKEIPDAKLFLISSDPKNNEIETLIKELGLSKNIIYKPFTQDIQKYFLDSSVFFFPSLTEAFPMALNEAKAYGLPCVGFNVDYSYPYKKGVIKVEMFDYEGLAKEIIKLLKDYNYRVKMGKEAKESLNMFNNNKTTIMWGNLFNSLLDGEKRFQRLRKIIKNRYFNMQTAKNILEKQFEYIKQYNKFLRCYTLDDFTNLEKINTIKLCQNITS